MNKYVEKTEPPPDGSGSRRGKGGRKGRGGKEGRGGKGGRRGGRGKGSEAEPVDGATGSEEKGSRKRLRGAQNLDILKKIKLLQGRKGKGKGQEETGNVDGQVDAESIDSQDD